MCVCDWEMERERSMERLGRRRSSPLRSARLPFVVVLVVDVVVGVCSPLFGLLVKETALYALDELGEEAVGDANEVDDVSLPVVEGVEVRNVVGLALVLLGECVGELLELFLEEFEEVLLGGAGLEEVGEYVGPAEDAAVACELVGGCLQELYVGGAHAQVLHEVLSALASLALLFVGDLGGLFVRVVAMVVELVVFELGLDGFALLVLRGSVRRIVLVAVVVATSGRAVLLPIASAEPAKLVSTASRALLTRHVHATTILLDRSSAFGALLRIGDQPLDVLTLARFPLSPVRHLLARGWHVVTDIGIVTIETPIESTLAMHSSRPLAHVNSHHHRTSRRRAILEQWVVRNHTNVQELLITRLQFIRSEQIAPSLIVHLLLTLRRRTMCRCHHLRRLSQRRRQIMRPTILTKAMTTRQRIGIHSKEGILADWAHILKEAQAHVR